MTEKKRCRGSRSDTENKNKKYKKKEEEGKARKGLVLHLLYFTYLKKKEDIKSHRFNKR